MNKMTSHDIFFCVLVCSLALPCLSEDVSSIHEWRANRNKNTRETIAELVAKLPADRPYPAEAVDKLANVMEREVHLSGYEWDSMERRKKFLSEITTPDDRTALIRVFRSELSSSDPLRRLKAVDVLGHLLMDEESISTFAKIYNHGWELQDGRVIPLAELEKLWVSNASSVLGATVDASSRNAVLVDAKQPFEVRINALLSVQAGGVELEEEILGKLLRDDDIMISYTAFKGKRSDNPIAVASAAWQLERIASGQLSSAPHAEYINELLFDINFILYYSFYEHPNVVKPYAEKIRNSIVKIMTGTDESRKEQSAFLLPCICREGDTDMIRDALLPNHAELHNGAIKACRKLSQSERFSLHDELLKIVYSESESVIDRLLAARIVAKDRNLPLTGNESLPQLMSILH